MVEWSNSTCIVSWTRSVRGSNPAVSFEGEPWGLAFRLRKGDFLSLAGKGCLPLTRGSSVTASNGDVVNVEDYSLPNEYYDSMKEGLQ